MRFEYTSELKTTIKVTLQEGEVLTNFFGPLVLTVPASVGNKEYDYIVSRKYKIFDYIKPKSVPASVTPLQARKILRLMGYMDELEALIADAPIEVQDAWQYASSFERNNPILLEFANDLHLDEEDIDNLFIQAATL